MSDIRAEFWAGQKVFLTGHTGFKGSWATLWLSQMGAQVTGFALAPDSRPALFDLGRVAERCDSVIGDIRDHSALVAAMERSRPDIVIHMAAQALVRPSYTDPVGTFDANVMGTAHVLEAVREVNTARTVLVVTTDKVYENAETGQLFKESDPLGGYDPYSASKAAAEILAASWRRSFMEAAGIRLATARGGNVIGGGDFSADRIVPDIWRAARQGEILQLRYPTATRPWQHVLDCLAGYFSYVQVLHGTDSKDLPHSLNFGPRKEHGTATVAELAEAVQSALGIEDGWSSDNADAPHEMARLALDPAAAEAALGWQSRLDTGAAIDLTAAWYRGFAAGEDVATVTLRQIQDFME